MVDVDSLRQKYPGWEKLNAYERTKIACKELTLDGAQIPGWIDMRELIGKGSAGDINRAKRDFRLEHAQELRALEDVAPAGVPTELSEHILAFWQLARKHAKAAYSEMENSLLAKVREAEDASEHAQAQALDARQALATEQARSQGLNEARDALASELQSERQARTRAELAKEQARTDAKEQVEAAQAQANEQITRLETALAKAQADLSTALDRLEGAQRHSIMQIELARTETREVRADYEARLKRAQEDLTLSGARAKQTQDRLQTELRDTQRALSESRAAYAAASVRLEQAARELDSLKAHPRKTLKSERLGRRPSKRLRNPAEGGKMPARFPKRATRK